MGHAAIPLIGRKARKPLVGMEPLRRREQRYFEGQAAVRARWMVTVLSGVVLAVGGLLWSQLGVAVACRLPISTRGACVARRQASHFTVDNLPRLRHLGSIRARESTSLSNRWRRPAKHAVRACQENVKQLLVGRLP
jgi:hypothetical protein